MAILEVEGLGVAFRTASALEAVSLGVDRGQRVGLIGESGAGKSLLALAILDLLPASARRVGTITFDGKILAAEADHQPLRGRRIGAILAGAADSLDPLKTARAHLDEALAHGSAETSSSTDALVASLALDPGRMALYPDRLTLAERQKLMVALALAAKPELLVADEPAAGLDLADTRRVLDAIERACSNTGMALLLISRELKAVAMLCSRIVVLHGGRIVEAGEKAEVLGHPRDDFTRSVLIAGRNRDRTLMRTPIGDELLAAKGITKRYRTRPAALFARRTPIVALDNVSFAMRAGESMAFVGASGSGKSTLARIVAGLERVSRGELQFDGRRYHGTDLSPASRADISMVFADPRLSLDRRLTLGEIIAQPLRLEAQPVMEELGARMVEVVTAVGLSASTFAAYPGDLSLADQHRAAVARALITRPRLVVLDDPVAVLDIAMRGEMLALLNRLRADFGLTFLITGDDLDTVRAIADRVAIMDRGRIVETGTPAQLLERPEHPATRQLVAAALPEIGIVPVF